MISTIKKYLNNTSGRDLYSYADTSIECVALYFIFVCYLIWWCISRMFLFITCPIWVVPYCIFKSRRKKKHESI